MNWITGIALIVLTAGTSCFGQNLLSLATTYTHTCDASAAVALNADRFVVASDEDNVLRIYSLSHPGPPVSAVYLSAFLQLTKKSLEADLEGAARVGNRIFWISSHSTSSSGKASPHRQSFFATDIRTTNDETTVVPVGALCHTLLRDLIREPKLSQLDGAATCSERHGNPRRTGRRRERAPAP